MPTMEAAAVPVTQFVRESRVIRAPRHKVYEAWVTPEIMKQWYGPANRTCSDAELDVREGGAFKITMPAIEGMPMPPNAPKIATTEGVYVEVVPDRKLQFTWNSNWGSGESLVTITFDDAPGGTEVTVLHERLAGDNIGGYGQGWKAILEKLATVNER